MLNFISTRVSELVSVLSSLTWSQFKIRFRFWFRFRFRFRFHFRFRFRLRIPDSGFSIRPLTTLWLKT